MLLSIIGLKCLAERAHCSAPPSSAVTRALFESLVQEEVNTWVATVAPKASHQLADVRPQNARKYQAFL